MPACALMVALVGVAAALVAACCAFRMNREAAGLQVSGCCLALPPLAEQTGEPSRGRRRAEEGWLRATPRRAAPFTGGAWPIRRRGTVRPLHRNGFG